MALSSSSGRSLKVATLYQISIIILHCSVEASLNESDMIVALVNYTASFNGNPYEGISPRRGPEASSID